MAIAIDEQADSREQVMAADGTLESATLRYGVTGSSDEAAVHLLVQQTIPSFYAGIIVQKYSIKPEGNGVWYVDVQYGSKEKKQPGQSSFKFSVKGERTKLTTALAHTAFVPSGRDEINFHNAINVRSGSGALQVEGIEKEFPQFSFSVSRIMASPLPGGFVQRLIDSAWHVNRDAVTLNIDDVTLNFAAGELLFQEAEGGKRGVDDWEITMNFAASKNVTNMIIGPYVNEIQTVSANGAAEFTLTYDSQTTTPLYASSPPYGSPDGVEESLQALANIGVGNVRVTGARGGPWRVEFCGDLANTDVNEMTANSSGSVATVVTTQEGGAASGAATITGVNKLGWEYLWIFYEDYKEETPPLLVKRPRQANVEQVYETTELQPLFL